MRKLNGGEKSNRIDKKADGYQVSKTVFQWKK